VKAKLTIVLAVGLFMFMHTATSAGPQRISSFTGLVKGEGTLTVDNENSKITGVWVNLIPILPTQTH